MLLCLLVLFSLHARKESIIGALISLHGVRRQQHADLTLVDQCSGPVSLQETREYLQLRPGDCHTSLGQPGLQCEEAEDGCLVNYLWCRDTNSSSCTLNNITIRTNDTNLCQQPLIKDTVQLSWSQIKSEIHI